MTLAASGMAFSVRPPAPAPAVRRPCACAASGGARARARADKWWAPLLGWSGQADYVDARPAGAGAAAKEGEAEARQQHHPRRFGVLTEDKARQLRTRMMEADSFHDAMYHSAIASRLASAAPQARGGAIAR